MSVDINICGERRRVVEVGCDNEQWGNNADDEDGRLHATSITGGEGWGRIGDDIDDGNGLR